MRGKKTYGAKIKRERVLSGMYSDLVEATPSGEGGYPGMAESRKMEGLG